MSTTQRPRTTEAASFLYRNGYQVLHSEKMASLANHFSFLHELETTRQAELFKQDPKNAGSLTLDFQSDAGKKLIPQFVQVLFDSGLMQEVIETLGHPIYLTNFLHMITRPGDKKLGWHRDTYFDGEGKVIGPVPPGYKIMIYNSAVENGSEFELVAGTHRLDFNSTLIDRLMAELRAKNFVFRGKQGASLLFDISAVHRRRAPSPKQTPRSATIFGFLRTRWQQSAFLPKHVIEIDAYNEHLKALGYRD